MEDVVDHLYQDIAVREAQHGRRTGGFSKVLSHISLLLLAMAVIHMVSRQEVVPALLAAVGFVPLAGALSLPSWLACIAYLVYLEDLAGLSFLVGSFAANLTGCWIGFRDARTELIERTTGISPFEGTWAAPSLIIQSVSFAIGYLTHGFISYLSYSVLAVTLFYSLTRYLFRMYPRWARIHYAMMFRWSSFAAMAVIRNKDNPEKADIGVELVALVRSIFPNKSFDDAQTLVNESDLVRRSFSDRSQLEVFYKRNNPSIDVAQLCQFMDKLGTLLGKSDDDNALRVRYVIASIIENDFGVEERSRYLDAVFEGKAG